MDEASRTGELPADLTSFVGRRRELADVRRAVGQSPLVTLTGIGGVGKTRLAFEAARLSRRAFPDGVRFVDLAPLEDTALVAEAVSAAVGLHSDSSRSSLNSLAEFVSGKQILLLLDNCEHLVDSCAVLAESLLRAAPDLRILTTSRQPLKIAGEQVITVAPLAIPDEDDFFVEALPKYDAVALFLDRARIVRTDFTLDEHNAWAVSRLVQRLDGIPLALELAAARLRVLSPEQIQARLDDRYRFLGDRYRTSHPHQRNLRTLIDWSYDLCSPEERALWVRLSVFPGDFDIEAAEDICSAEELPSPAVLDALVGLVEKSILVVVERRGDVRYRLPETLREYARMNWESTAEEVAVKRRHLDYFERIARRAGNEWFGPDQVRWTHWVSDEYVNLRAALEFALTEPAEKTGIIAAARFLLGTYWFVTGRFAEAERLLDRTLELRPEPTVERANALWLRAWIAINRGEVAQARATAVEGRQLGEHLSDARSEATATGVQGIAAYLDGDLDLAQVLLQRALDVSRSAIPTSGASEIIASSISYLGAVAGTRGDVRAAIDRFRESVDLCESLGESWVRGVVLYQWALFGWQIGDDGAGDLLLESLRLRAQFPDIPGVASCLSTLGWLEADMGSHDRAARLIGGAQQLFDATGTQLLPDLVAFEKKADEMCRTALGTRAYGTAIRLGTRMSLTDLVAYALGEEVDTARADGADVHLTRRESEIAQLVAKGLSNRDIAAELVIATRTVEGHVEHVLAKLGFTSRTQIAAWCAATTTPSRPD